MSLYDLGLLHGRWRSTLRNLSCDHKHNFLANTEEFAPRPHSPRVTWRYHEIRALLRAFKKHGVILRHVHELTELTFAEWFTGLYGWLSPTGMVRAVELNDPRALDSLFRLAPKHQFNNLNDREVRMQMATNHDGIMAMKPIAQQAVLSMRYGWEVHFVQDWAMYSRAKERENRNFAYTRARLKKERLLDQLTTRRLAP